MTSPTLPDITDETRRRATRRAQNNAPRTSEVGSPAESKSKESKECRGTPESGEVFDDFDDSCDAVIPENDDFPIECLPGAAGDIARAVSDCALVPLSLSAMNVLGILSAAIGAGLEVASGGDRRTRANLFLMPVARSGTGKGQSFGLIAHPFIVKETARLEDWRRHERPQIVTQHEMAEARMAKLKKSFPKAQSVEAEQQMRSEWLVAQREKDQAAKAMREPAWSAEEATKEAIQSLLETSPQESLAILSSEARGAVDVLMGRYKDATDESIFLAGYSGDPVKIHRKSSSPVLLHCPCLTILWAMQPDKLRTMLESTAMTESGLLPRFLLADTLAEPQEEPEVRQSVPESVKERWRELVHGLLDEYHEANLPAQVIKPEPEATKCLRDYTNEIVRRRRSGGDLEDVNIYAARWGENAWRLALVLHAAKHGDEVRDHPLGGDTAEQAVRLMRWFSQQQLKVLASGRQEQAARRLDRLIEVLRNKEGHKANLSELKVRHGIEPSEVRQLTEMFPAKVEVVRIPTAGAGRPPWVARLK